MAAIDELTQAMTTLKQKGDECSQAWATLKTAQSAFSNAQEAVNLAKTKLDEEIGVIDQSAAKAPEVAQ